MAKGLKAVNNYAYLFLLPFFLTFLIFQLYPMIYSVGLSFTDTYAIGAETVEGKFIWFDNYVALWEDPQFYEGREVKVFCQSDFNGDYYVDLESLTAYEGNSNSFIEGEGEI